MITTSSPAYYHNHTTSEQDMKPIVSTHRKDIIADIAFDCVVLFIIIWTTLLVARS